MQSHKKGGAISTFVRIRKSKEYGRRAGEKGIYELGAVDDYGWRVGVY